MKRKILGMLLAIVMVIGMLPLSELAGLIPMAEAAAAPAAGAVNVTLYTGGAKLKTTGRLPVRADGTKGSNPWTSTTINGKYVSDPGYGSNPIPIEVYILPTADYFDGASYGMPEPTLAFDGWYTNPEYSGSAVTVPVSGGTYYAKWKRTAAVYQGSSMKYEFKAGAFDPMGGSNGSIQTTYGHSGFKTVYSTSSSPSGNGTSLSYPTTGQPYVRIGSTDLYVMVSAHFEGAYISMDYYLWNRGSTATSLSFGSWTDIQIGSNDSAPITFVDDGTVGKYAGMEGSGNELRMYFQGGNGSMFTPVSTYWAGHYGSASASVWTNLQNNVTNTDSGVAFSWKGVPVPANTVVVKNVLFGAGKAGSLDLSALDEAKSTVEDAVDDFKPTVPDDDQKTNDQKKDQMRKELEDFLRDRLKEQFPNGNPKVDITDVDFDVDFPTDREKGAVYGEASVTYVDENGTSHTEKVDFEYELPRVGTHDVILHPSPDSAGAVKGTAVTEVLRYTVSEGIWAPPSHVGGTLQSFFPAESGYVFVGWSKSADGSSPNVTSVDVKDTVELWAVWAAEKKVEVTVKVQWKDTSEPVDGAKVRLLSGADDNKGRQDTTTDGQCKFSSVQPGDYFAEVTFTDSDTDITKTVLVTVTESGANTFTVELSKSNNANTNVEVDATTSPSLAPTNPRVGGLEDEAEKEADEESSKPGNENSNVTVDVSMNLILTQSDIDSGRKTALENLHKEKEYWTYFNAKVVKTVTINNVPQTPVVMTSTGTLLEIVLDYTTAGRQSIQVHRYMNGVAEDLKPTFTRLTGNALTDKVGGSGAFVNDGYYYVGNNYIVIYASTFDPVVTTYAVSNNPIVFERTSPVTVTVNGEVGGTAGSSQVMAAPRSTVILYAIPEKDYAFDYFEVTSPKSFVDELKKEAGNTATENGVKLGTDRFSMPEDAVQVTAYFAKIERTCECDTRGNDYNCECMSKGGCTCDPCGCPPDNFAPAWSDSDSIRTNDDGHVNNTYEYAVIEGTLGDDFNAQLAAVKRQEADNSLIWLIGNEKSGNQAGTAGAQFDGLDPTKTYTIVARSRGAENPKIVIAVVTPRYYRDVTEIPDEVKKEEKDKGTWEDFVRDNVRGCGCTNPDCLCHTTMVGFHYCSPDNSAQADYCVPAEFPYEQLSAQWNATDNSLTVTITDAATGYTYEYSLDGETWIKVEGSALNSGAFTTTGDLDPDVSYTVQVRIAANDTHPEPSKDGRVGLYKTMTGTVGEGTGTIQVDNAQHQSGTTVTITVKAEDGKLGRVYVKDSKGKVLAELEGTEEDGTYTYTYIQPTSDITVVAEFLRETAPEVEKSGSGSGVVTFPEDETTDPENPDGPSEPGQSGGSSRDPDPNQDVTFKPEPDPGDPDDPSNPPSKVGNVRVTWTDEDGEEHDVPVTDNGDGSYTFTPPVDKNGDVIETEIDVEFVPEGTPGATPDGKGAGHVDFVDPKVDEETGDRVPPEPGDKVKFKPVPETSDPSGDDPGEDNPGEEPKEKKPDSKVGNVTVTWTDEDGNEHDLPVEGPDEDGNYSFEQPPNGDVDIKVEFVPEHTEDLDIYAPVVEKTGNGTGHVDFNENRYPKKNERVTFTPEAETELGGDTPPSKVGDVNVTWTEQDPETGEDVTHHLPVTKNSDGSYSFNQPEGSDVTIVVEFIAANAPGVVKTGNGAGSVSFEKSEAADGTTREEARYPEAGDTVTFQPEAEDGSRIGDVRVKNSRGDDITDEVGLTQNEDGSYSFTYPGEGEDQDVTIEVEFNQKPKPLPPQTEPEGPILKDSPEGKGSGTTIVENPDAAPGEDMTVIPEPEPGSKVGGVKAKDADGNDLPVVDNGDGTYTVEQPENGPATIETEYVRETAPEVEDTTGGTVTVTPRDPDPGEDVTFTPKPDPGYEVGDVVVKDQDGNELPVTKNEDGSYSFEQPEDGYVTIEVTFVPSLKCERDETCPIDPFTDANNNAWYHDGVHFVLEHGLMVGYGNNIFRPGSTTSRAMIATILWRMEGSPIVDSSVSFEDVKDGAWYADAVRWAESVGVVEGYSDKAFGPDDPITREQLAAMLHRYAVLKGYDASKADDLRGYSDASAVSGWAVEDMRWAVGVGIIRGMTKTTLEPGANGSRAEAATMIYRFCCLYRTDLTDSTVL